MGTPPARSPPSHKTTIYIQAGSGFSSLQQLGYLIPLPCPSPENQEASGLLRISSASSWGMPISRVGSQGSTGPNTRGQRQAPGFSLHRGFLKSSAQFQVLLNAVVCY